MLPFSITPQMFPPRQLTPHLALWGGTGDDDGKAAVFTSCHIRSWQSITPEGKRIRTLDPSTLNESMILRLQQLAEAIYSISMRQPFVNFSCRNTIQAPRGAFHRRPTSLQAHTVCSIPPNKLACDFEKWFLSRGSPLTVPIAKCSAQGWWVERIDMGCVWVVWVGMCGWCGWGCVCVCVCVRMRVLKLHIQVPASEFRRSKMLVRKVVS